MNIDRRQLALPALAIGLLGVVPAFAASADEDAVAKSVEDDRAGRLVAVVRGEHDGIASEEDLLDFYRLLPNPDRQFAVMPGAAHALVFGHNRHQLWHVVHAFLTMPERRDG